jgi:glutathione S-transferase
MSLQLYGHPFSSYCQKVLAALYENDIPFEFRTVNNPQTAAEWEALWPLKRFPVLVDAGRTLVESSVIIEYLKLSHPGPVTFIPDDPNAALDVRTMDRFFDNYIMTPMQRIVSNGIRPEKDRDPIGVSEARTMLDRAYGWLDRAMARRDWATGANLTLADCAAAPALFYADWAHAIGESLTHVRAYRERLLAWPSFARAVDEARPYRHLFPLGAPDRD